MGFDISSHSANKTHKHKCKWFVGGLYLGAMPTPGDGPSKSTQHSPRGKETLLNKGSAWIAAASSASPPVQTATSKPSRPLAHAAHVAQLQPHSRAEHLIVAGRPDYSFHQDAADCIKRLSSYAQTSFKLKK